MGFGFGGFLRLMSDTNKENRVLAKWATRKRNNKKLRHDGDSESLVLRSRQMSEEETMVMVRGIMEEQKQVRRRRIFALLASMVITVPVIIIIREVVRMFILKSR